jgi:hypothetical protein
MVVKSATASVREFKKGCEVCYSLCCNLWLYPLDLNILQPESRSKFLVPESHFRVSDSVLSTWWYGTHSRIY